MPDHPRAPPLDGRALREQQLAREVRKAREDLPRRAEENARRERLPWPPSTDAALQAVQAWAVEAADAPIGSMGTAIGRIMGKAARRAAGLAVSNPKLQQADLKPLRGRKVDEAAFYSRLNRAENLRQKGDPRAPTIHAVAGAILFKVRTGAVGYARATFEEIARLAKCCRDTALEVVRWLEEHGLLDTFNVLTRQHGQVRRAANLYLIPDTLSDRAPPEPRSRAERLNHYAGWFGLRARPWGLNATPASVGYRPSTRRAAPS